MTGREDNFTMGKIVFDDSNQETRLWACLKQTCSRFLNAFLCPVSVILLIIFWLVLENSSFKMCDESTVWVAVL